MSEQVMTDDSSHYEISLTAGQAFLAFVLLLFSLAASFTFGLMVGKGQTDDRLVVKRELPVINEGSGSSAKQGEARIVELGVPKSSERELPAADTERAATVPTSVIEDHPAAAAPEVAAPSDARSDDSTADTASPAPAAAAPVHAVEHQASVTEHRVAAVAAQPVQPRAAAPRASSGAVVYAQLLSSGDAHAAESLAAKLIDAGFTSAYVERTPTASGMTYRVRVKFSSEDDARSATDRLRSISKSDPWIVRQ